jgi:hypothetical protein
MKNYNEYPYHFVLHNKEQGLIGIIEYNGNSVEFNELLKESLGSHFDLENEIIQFTDVSKNKLDIEFNIELHTLIDGNSEILFLEKKVLFKKN